MPFKSPLYHASKERGDPCVWAYYSMHPNGKLRFSVSLLIADVA